LSRQAAEKSSCGGQVAARKKELWQQEQTGFGKLLG